MKKLACSLSVVALAMASPHIAAHADGPPGPPGSDAARMKTLNQVEPRQVVDSLPFIITNSGPYVLTANLTGGSKQDGITIQADSVTLDLNGFTLQGDGSYDGITVSGAHTFVVIRNGVISGWNDYGIDAASANNSKLIDVLIAGNGNDGARLGTNSTVHRCTALNNGDDGFDVGENCILTESVAKGNQGSGFRAQSGAVIDKCVADQNSVQGFDARSVAQISRCTASDNYVGFYTENCCTILDSCAYRNYKGFGGYDGTVFSRCVAYENTYGFFAQMNCSFSHCSAYTNYYMGIYGDMGCSVVACTAYRNTFNGIGARNGSSIENCSSYENGENGFWIGAATTVQGCSAMLNASNGIIVLTGSHVFRNTCRANSYAGIAANEECRIEDNHLTSCGTGLLITGTDNRVAGNIVLGNTQEYDLAQGNHLDLLISRVPMTISWPAHTRLAGSLTGISGYDGITISSSDVCLDLGGHALAGVAGSLNGVSIQTGVRNVEVKNGTISGWGYYGIHAGGTRDITVADIRCGANGSGSAAADGIFLATNSVLKDCIVSENRDLGAYLQRGCTVADCIFADNGNKGVYLEYGCTIRDCLATGNTNDGIYAYQDCKVLNCMAKENGDEGIQVHYDCTVENSSCMLNADDGLYAYADNHIRNNTCNANGTGGEGFGIYVFSSGNTIDGNLANDNDIGIRIANAGSLAIRNRASGNSTNYLFNAGSTWGPFVSGTGAITSENPWANFEF